MSDKATKTEITYGNVFLALGFEEPEASNLHARSMLMIEIRSIFEAEKMTQKEAAEHFGINQRRISALLNGRIEKFTVDGLMNMLIRSGRPVAVVTKDKLRLLPSNTTRRKVMNTIFPPTRC